MNERYKKPHETIEPGQRRGIRRDLTLTGTDGQPIRKPCVPALILLVSVGMKLGESVSEPLPLVSEKRDEYRS